MDMQCYLFSELVSPEAKLVADLRKKYDRNTRPVLDVRNVTTVGVVVTLGRVESLVCYSLRHQQCEIKTG